MHVKFESVEITVQCTKLWGLSTLVTGCEFGPWLVQCECKDAWIIVLIGWETTSKCKNHFDPNPDADCWTFKVNTDWYWIAEELHSNSPLCDSYTLFYVWFLLLRCIWLCWDLLKECVCLKSLLEIITGLFQSVGMTWIKIPNHVQTYINPNI